MRPTKQLHRVWKSKYQDNTNIPKTNAVDIAKELEKY